MLISRYELQVTPDFEITRTATGVDLTFFYGLSGSYDPDAELYYWAGEIIADLGDDQGYVYQDVDRPMDMSFSATLQDGVTEYGHYEISDYGDRGAYLNLEFAVTTFSSAALYVGTDSVSNFVFGSEQDDQLFGGRSDDVFDGAGGDDKLVGNDGDDQLIGGAGADELSGRTGEDSLSGGAGADLLDGGGNDDRVIGGRGEDRLQGGLGQDTLTGGSGADSFLFKTAPSAADFDLIRDFASGLDKIVLNDTAFGGLAGPGALPAGAFAANASGVAIEADDRIVYDTTTGFLSYDADGSGAGEAVVFARLKPAAALVESDFQVI